MTSASTSPNTAPAGNWIIYDGDCPFCTNYMRLTKLKESIGPVRLINARDGGPEVEFVKAQGLDLDQGMAMYYQGQLYHGGDCLNIMAMLSSESGLFNSFSAWVFKSKSRARALYPSLKCGRNLALRLLGRTKISGEKF
jgi:predicted DCC family thiol-disulfide oxidoreductase YuxK